MNIRSILCALFFSPLSTPILAISVPPFVPIIPNAGIGIPNQERDVIQYPEIEGIEERQDAEIIIFERGATQRIRWSIRDIQNLFWFSTLVERVRNQADRLPEERQRLTERVEIHYGPQTSNFLLPVGSFERIWDILVAVTNGDFRCIHYQVPRG